MRNSEQQDYPFGRKGSIKRYRVNIGDWVLENKKHWIGGWVSVDISNTRKEPCTAQKYIHYPQEVFLKSLL